MKSSWNAKLRGSAALALVLVVLFYTHPSPQPSLEIPPRKSPSPNLIA